MLYEIKKLKDWDSIPTKDLIENLKEETKNIFESEGYNPEDEGYYCFAENESDINNFKEKFGITDIQKFIESYHVFNTKSGKKVYFLDFVLNNDCVMSLVILEDLVSKCNIDF